MRELSLHLLDIAENSVRAGAGRIYITVDETPGRIQATVSDDGCGIDEAPLARLRRAANGSLKTNPPDEECKKADRRHECVSEYPEARSRTPDAVRGGRGIALLGAAARKTGGGVIIRSERGRGTSVTAEFFASPDGIPLGDAAASVVTLAQGSPDIDCIFTYQSGAEKFSVDTRERMAAFSDGIPGSGDFAAYMRLLEFIRDGIRKIYGRRQIKMKNLEELCALRDRMKPTMGIRADDSGNTRVIVGMATCGIEAGARPVLLSFVDECAKNKLTGVTVAQTGCLGMCAQEPVVEVIEPGKEKVTYVKMTAEKAAEVVKNHLIGGKAISEYTISATNK